MDELDAYNEYSYAVDMMKRYHALAKMFANMGNSLQAGVHYNYAVRHATEAIDIRRWSRNRNKEVSPTPAN